MGARAWVSVACEVCLSGVCCELGVLVRVLGVKTLE